jgi:hypothetical protein
MVEIKIAIVKLLQAFHLQADETTRYFVMLHGFLALLQTIG